VFFQEADGNVKYISSISGKCSGLKDLLKEVMSNNQIGLESFISFELNSKPIPFSDTSLNFNKIFTFTNIIFSNGSTGKKNYFIFSFVYFRLF
jgi:hypothetical protein